MNDLNQTHPDNAAIMNALGVAHYWIAEPDEAEKLFKEARKIEPSDTIIQRNLDEMF